MLVAARAACNAALWQITWWALLPLPCAFLFVGYQLLTRKLAGHDDAITTLFYPGLIAVLAIPPVFPGAISAVPTMPLHAVLLAAILGAVGHFLLIRAHTLAPATLLAPFGYAQLLVVLVLGWLVFGQLPDGIALAGIVLVAASGLGLIIASRRPAAGYTEATAMLGEAAIAMWWDIAPEVKSEFEDWHSHEHMPERLAIPGFLRGTRSIADSGESFFILYELDKLATLTGGAYLERLNTPTPWSRRMMPHHRNMARSLCAVRASFGGVAGDARGQTTEQKIRGNDARADWVVQLGGYDRDAVKAAAHELHLSGAVVGLYSPVYSLCAGE